MNFIKLDKALVDSMGGTEITQVASKISSFVLNMNESMTSLERHE